MTANAAFQTYLHTNAFDGRRFPLHRNMAAKMYAGLNGLGDDDSTDGSVNLDFLTDPTNPQTQELLDSINRGDFAPSTQPAPTAGGDSWWTDVLKSISAPLATGIGLGVGGKIAGVNPWAKPIVNPLATSMSTTTKLLLAGGAVVVGAYVISRLAKSKS